MSLNDAVRKKAKKLEKCGLTADFSTENLIVINSVDIGISIYFHYSTTFLDTPNKRIKQVFGVYN